MTIVTPDPLAVGGIVQFGEQLRAGLITSEQATRAYLSRIEALDRRLGAFQHVAVDSAVATARAMDALLASGTDLGPLMGVPVAVKDIFAVDGMATTAGSHLDVSDLIGGEGSFVKRLKRAGCVILGKTKTVEFALGITGLSTPKGTPWNPWDWEIQRLPGGSSSGSAVAVAAGLCTFAIGSDTGGSVRVPAALCGTVGLKTTFNLWPVDGVFPLAAHLDTVGLLTKTVADAGLAFAALSGQSVPLPMPLPMPLQGLRLGRPDGYFFQNLEPDVEVRTRETLAALERAGAEIIEIEVPEAAAREHYFPVVLPTCLIAALGRERFLAACERMDPIVAMRGDNGLEVKAADYVRLEQQRAAHSLSANARFHGLDAWISPTVTLLAPPASDAEDRQRGMQLTLGMTQNSQPANYLGLSAVTLPIHGDAGSLPVGLQLMCPAHEDLRALAIALAVESVIGPGATPPLKAFLAGPSDGR
jgi:aspartyl-tRNA(Asn)/glutamyl-tRNA(Gln) amidotransferase subunit A